MEKPAGKCLNCGENDITYETVPCRHKTLCKACAMKQATGGKCKTTVQTLVLTLPPQFPLVAPSASIQPPLLFTHEWIVETGGPDAENFVIVNGFEHWNQHLDLARIVAELIDGLISTARPAAASSYLSTSPPSSRVQPPAIPPKLHAVAGANSATQSPTTHQSVPLDITGLESKTLEELEELLADPIAFEEHLYSLPRIAEAQKLREEAARVNAEAAGKTLALQSDLFNSRESLRTTQASFLVALESYEQCCKRYDAAMLVMAPDYLLSRLRAAQSESDELGDSLVMSLLRGELPVDEFLKQYREARRVYHARSIRVERGERDARIRTLISWGYANHTPGQDAVAGPNLAAQARKMSLLPNILLTPSSAIFKTPPSAIAETKPSISIPLAPKAEKPILDFLTSLSTTTLGPIFSILSPQNGISDQPADSAILLTIETSLASSLSEIANRVSSPNHFDFAHFASSKLIPIFTSHIRQARLAAIKASKLPRNENLDEALSLIKCFQGGELHPALSSWRQQRDLKKPTSSGSLPPEQTLQSEIEYLKSLVSPRVPRGGGIVPLLFPQDSKSSVFNAFIVEMLAGQVLKRCVDMLADADFWNVAFDAMGDQAISQEHVLAKRIAEAVDKQIAAENDEFDKRRCDADNLVLDGKWDSISGQTLAPEGSLAYLVSHGTMDQILDAIQSNHSSKEVALLKENVVREIQREKGKLALLSEDYIDAIKIREVKCRIKNYSKILKRVKKRLRLLKRKKRNSITNLPSEMQPLMSIENLLKNQALFSQFQEFCRNQAGEVQGRPNYCQILAEVSQLEHQTWAAISSCSNLDASLNPFERVDSLASLNGHQDSCPDMSDFYDMDDISVPLPLMQSVKAFVDANLTPQFWLHLSRKSCTSSSVCPSSSNTLESDMRHLRDRITKRIQYMFASPMSEASNRSYHLHMNDLEPLWKLRIALVDELDAYEWKRFAMGRVEVTPVDSDEDHAAPVNGAIRKEGHRSSNDYSNMTSPEPEKKRFLHSKKWAPTKLHSKKVFAWLHRDSQQRRDKLLHTTALGGNEDSVNEDGDEDEYIKSFIIPLKDDELDSAHEDMFTEDEPCMPVIEVCDASSASSVASPASGGGRRKKSMDFFGAHLSSFTRDSRRFQRTSSDHGRTLGVRSEDDASVVKPSSIMKKLKDKAMEELSGLNRWKTKQFSADDPNSAEVLARRSRSLSHGYAVGEREERERKSVLSQFRKREGSSASLESFTIPKSANLLCAKTQSVESILVAAKPASKSILSKERINDSIKNFNQKFSLRKTQVFPSTKPHPNEASDTPALSSETLKENSNSSLAPPDLTKRRHSFEPTSTTLTDVSATKGNPSIYPSQRYSVQLDTHSKRLSNEKATSPLKNMIATTERQASFNHSSVSGSNRSSIFNKAASRAKGIIQKVSTNSAETLKSGFRAWTPRKMISDDEDNSPRKAKSGQDLRSAVRVPRKSSHSKSDFATSAPAVIEKADEISVEGSGYESTETDMEMKPGFQFKGLPDGVLVEENPLDSTETSATDMLLPSLTTPRILELEEQMDATKAELEDVQEHILNSDALEFGATKIRALHLMKAGLEVEIQKLERDRQACKERDLENLIMPGSTSVSVNCTQGKNELILFEIVVQLINADGVKSGWIVHRKLSEFITLQQSLKLKFPIVNQYELPSKKMFKGLLKLRKTFIEKRRSILSDYLQNLLSNIEICKSIEFRMFICHIDIIRILYSASLPANPQSMSGKAKKRKPFVKTLFHRLEENISLIKRNNQGRNGGSAVGASSRLNSVALGYSENPGAGIDGSHAAGCADGTVDALFDLITETFELKEKGNYIRRKALTLVLQHIIGGTIERRVTESLRALVSEDSMAQKIDALRISLFHSTWAPRTAEEKTKTRKSSSSKMSHLSVGLLGKVVGKKNAKRGALKFVWVFQNELLNRHLAYTILDEFVEAIFGKG
ncbi:Intermediate filament protein [Chytriomyces hyalinus]|nr:Intermediate filament protein [Chytriomyces hyalinus]